MKKIREYNQPIMRLKACYKCLKWFHDLERPRKIKRLYSTTIGGELAVKVNLSEIRSLINCLNLSESDAKKIFLESIDRLDSEIQSAFEAGRAIQLGFVADSLARLTDMKKAEIMNIQNNCSTCWSQFGFSAIATWSL